MWDSVRKRFEDVTIRAGWAEIQTPEDAEPWLDSLAKLRQAAADGDRRLFEQFLHECENDIVEVRLKPSGPADGTPNDADKLIPNQSSSSTSRETDPIRNPLHEFITDIRHWFEKHAEEGSRE